jgi:hypothetical protein
MTIGEQKIYDCLGWQKDSIGVSPKRTVVWHAGDNEQSWFTRGKTPK